MKPRVNFSVVRVKKIPDCQMCNDGTPAMYDAKVPYRGWAYLCKKHFRDCHCQLGMGKGQRLEVIDPNEEV